MQYGIPYMGSKAKIAPSIAMCFPKAEHFYDLFGGGFSISHYMLQHKANRYKYFHYNEIKTDVTELVKQAINGDFNYNTFKPPWVSREDFFKYKDTDAYIRCIWSFGNNQRSYLFGLDIEEYKRSMHMAVVFNEFNDVAISVLGFNEWPKNVNNIIQKRFYLQQKIAYILKDKSANKKQLQQLQQLEQLQRLERLERLQQLTITSTSYQHVNILPNSVVYCDIPYQGTTDYANIFSHKEFFNWAATREFPVYISEYNVADPRFELVYTINKRVMLTQSGDKNKQAVEKLYWNKVKLKP